MTSFEDSHRRNVCQFLVGLDVIAQAKPTVRRLKMPFRVVGPAFRLEKPTDARLARVL